MMTRQCPTCQRNLSADLSLYHGENGFQKVTLGIQCKVCRTTYKAADFIRVMERVQKVRVDK